MLTTQQEIDARERLARIDLVHVAGEWIEETLLKDSPLRSRLADLQRLAIVKKEVGDIDYEVEVDVTAEPEVEDFATVGKIEIRIGSCTEKIPVVLECTGTDVVLGRTIKTYLARVAK